ncbi:AraC family transcriptional regulator [Thiohalomonas denitrificans]|uniref:AraC family transcriptional regulator n=1 Tax=Thiohalomonas denitrificans TaxID=415747 RepID=UPI0026EA1915|nr:AraC family transcriptional regulator [Thiohalomonas denitrificans]
MLLAYLPGAVLAEEVSKEQIKGLDEQVQEIKSEALGIAAALSGLEEKLLHPSNTQLSLFVALAEDDDFRLDAVEVQLDGKVVANHLYTFKELEALQQGGVQRLHTGNIRTGQHDLQVTLIGKSPGGAEYRHTADFTIEKGIGPKLVELVLAGPGANTKSISKKDW